MRALRLAGVPVADCIWCVGSAVCMLLPAVLSSARMLAPEPVPLA